MDIPRLKLKRIGNKLQIVEQYPDANHFTEFRASNGYRIMSSNYPEMTINKLFVKGRNPWQDNSDIIIYNNNQYEKLKVALFEFNKLLDYKFIENDGIPYNEAEQQIIDEEWDDDVEYEEEPW